MAAVKTEIFNWPADGSQLVVVRIEGVTLDTDKPIRRL